MQAAGQVADGFAGFHRRPSQNDPLDVAGLESFDGFGYRKICLPCAGRPQCQHHVIAVEGFDESALCISLRADVPDVSLVPMFAKLAARAHFPGSDIRVQCTDIALFRDGTAGRLLGHLDLMFILGIARNEKCSREGCINELRVWAIGRTVRARDHLQRV